MKRFSLYVGIAVLLAMVATTVRTNNFSLVPYGPELSNHLNEGAFTSPTCKGS